MSREPNRYINPDRVMLGENTRKEVRQALQSGRLKAAIVPVGAIEQHNEHLALNVDIVVSTFLSLWRRSPRSLGWMCPLETKTTPGFEDPIRCAPPVPRAFP